MDSAAVRLFHTFADEATAPPMAVGTPTRTSGGRRATLRAGCASVPGA
ncbi:MAG: hypothetical protein K6V97_11335 [Actinomycetia bacterium]|nr:hypothetical protein [Actinomycetes bacterium]